MDGNKKKNCKDCTKRNLSFFSAWKQNVNWFTFPTKYELWRNSLHAFIISFFCLIYKKRKTKVFLSLSNLFEITYFLSVFSILKFKQFLKKQCGESEKSPCRAKLCRLESKAGFSQSFELAHYSAVESNFLKSFFFPTSFTISSVSDLFSPLTLRVLFGRTDDDQLSPLFVTNVICAKVRNGYWPLENFQTKELPLNVFSRVLGSCPALEKNDGDEDMSLGGRVI